jgi:glycerate-2-kinase
MAALENNDANTYLAATDDLILTGPTGTNVADLWLVLNREPRGA